MGKMASRSIDEGRCKTDFSSLMNTDLVTKGIRIGLATGNWTRNKQGEYTKTGVSQVLSRLTYAASLSHLRRLSTPISRQMKIAKPRYLHTSHWGMICPAETPEG